MADEFEQQRSDMRNMQQNIKGFAPAILSYAQEKADQQIQIGLANKQIDYQQKVALERRRQEMAFDFQKRQTKFQQRRQLLQQERMREQQAERFRTKYSQVAQERGWEFVPESPQDLEFAMKYEQFDYQRQKYEQNLEAKEQKQEMIQKGLTQLGVNYKERAREMQQRAENADSEQEAMEYYQRAKNYSDYAGMTNVASSPEELMEMKQQHQQLQADKRQRQMEWLQWQGEMQLKQTKVMNKREDQMRRNYRDLIEMGATGNLPDFMKKRHGNEVLDEPISYPEYKQRMGYTSQGGMSSAQMNKELPDLARRARQRQYGKTSINRVVEARKELGQYFPGGPDDVHPAAVEKYLQKNYGETHLAENGQFLAHEELRNWEESRDLPQGARPGTTVEDTGPPRYKGTHGFVQRQFEQVRNASWWRKGALPGLIPLYWGLESAGEQLGYLEDEDDPNLDYKR